MVATTFWSADGKPISAAQFMESLFGTTPEFFKDEDQLRALWSAPDTRKALLQGLAEKGFGRDVLAEMQKLIDAEKSDLFDVLAYVAFAVPPVTREVRASAARNRMHDQFDYRQQQFIEFVLGQYVTQGVGELDQEKLSPLLKLRYHDAIQDAVTDLGPAEKIRGVFVGFQKYLYEGRTAQNSSLG